MKQYIFSAVCLMSGALCMSSCNEDKQAKPYTPDYEIVPEYTNADTWTAYEAFNDNLLDPDKNIYKTIIPRNVRLAEAPSHGKPINIYDTRSTGAESYRMLAAEVISRGEE